MKGNTVTPSELEIILNTMTDEDFKKFQEQFGGGNDRAGYVEVFTRQPEWDAVLSRILSQKTEEEKRDLREEKAANATIEAARHAADANLIALGANKLSRKANSLAFASIFISVLSVILSLIAILAGRGQ